MKRRERIERKGDVWVLVLRCAHKMVRNDVSHLTTEPQSSFLVYTKRSSCLENGAKKWTEKGECY